VPVSYHNHKMRFSYKCPECGASLYRRSGRYGQFFACSNCSYTEDAIIQK